MGGYRFYVRGYDDGDFPAFGALTGATLEARLPLMLMASGACCYVCMFVCVLRASLCMYAIRTHPTPKT